MTVNDKSTNTTMYSKVTLSVGRFYLPAGRRISIHYRDRRKRSRQTRVNNLLPACQDTAIPLLRDHLRRYNDVENALIASSEGCRFYMSVRFDHF